MTNTSLIRQKDESLKEFELRICSNKDLYDLSWKDVAAIINAETGKSWGESKYRKWYHVFSEGLEYAQLNASTTDDAIDNLTVKKLELQKERVKLQSEKNEVNKWIREQARTENIYEKVIGAITSLQPIAVPAYLTMPKQTSKTAILDIADSHFGREGKIIGLEGETLAEYSPEIFKRRMWELLDRSVKYLEKEGISSMTVLNLSDSIDGILRMSQLQFLQLGILDSAMQFAEFMAEWLNELSRYTAIEYRSVLGNHTEVRPLGSQKGDFAEENMERIMTWFIAERLKNNPRVTVHSAKNLEYFDVLGTKVLATHGQDERNLENSIKDYTIMYGKPIHVLRTGHLHTAHNKTVAMSGIQNIEFSQAPSMCGIDDYSVKLKKTANAGSLMTIYEEGYGKVCDYSIRLK